MKSVEWKAKRYDELMRLGGEQIVEKLDRYDSMKAKANALQEKADRYDELIQIAGEKTMSRLQQFDALAVEVSAYRWKALRYDNLVQIGGEQVAAKLRKYEKLIEIGGEKASAELPAGGEQIDEKLECYDSLKAKANALQEKADRYDELIQIAGEKTMSRLQQFDALAAEVSASRWKARRYDNLVQLGGEQVATKLRKYEELVELSGSRRWKARRYDELIEIGGEKASGKLRAYDKMADETRQLRIRAKRYETLAADLKAARQALQQLTGGQAVDGADGGAADAEGVASAKAVEPPYSVVFVLGAARTGTTLLGSFLAWSADSHALPSEAAPLFSAMRSHVNLIAASKRFMGDQSRIAADTALQIYFRMFFDAYYRQQGVSRLVFRSPGITRYFTELCELIDFVPVKFVCCVRDPRDACVSLLEWNRRTIEKGQRRPILPAPTATAAAMFFMDYYKDILAAREGVEPSVLTFVRYEDATGDARRVAKSLEAFTGIDLSDFDPEAPWPEQSYDFQARKAANLAVTPLYGEPPSDQQVGRYRDALTPEEIAKIEQICAPIFTAFGYERDTVDAAAADDDEADIVESAAIASVDGASVDGASVDEASVDETEDDVEIEGGDTDEDVESGADTDSQQTDEPGKESAATPSTP